MKEIKSDELSQFVVASMQEKKANDIVVLDLRHIKHAIADYFVICSGNSDTQVDAISNSIEESIFKATRQHAWHREGKQNKQWVLLDYVDVVAHVFQREFREKFDLEELWGDAQVEKVTSGY